SARADGAEWLADGGAVGGPVRAGQLRACGARSRGAAPRPRRVRRVGAACGAARARRRAGARGARLSPARVPLAALESAQRRVRWESGEPDALSTRGVRGG